MQIYFQGSTSYKTHKNHLEINLKKKKSLKQVTNILQWDFEPIGIPKEMDSYYI